MRFSRRPYSLHQEEVMNRILSGSVAVLCLFSFTAMAKPGPHHQCGSEKGMHKMVEKLDLTDEQQVELKKLKLDHERALLDYHPKVKEHRDKIKAELLKKNPDAAMLDKLEAKLGELHGQMASLKTDHMLKVKKLLEPEQFEKLMECDSGKKECMKKEKGCRHKGQ